MEKNCRRSARIRNQRSRRQVKQIDVLPDDVLLEIFDFYTKVDGPPYGGEKVRAVKARADAWQHLVHVCQRWRNLVFGSPRRLNLRLYCTPKTPVRDTLDVWPALPLVVDGNMALSSGTHDIIAALGKSNRVCEVGLRLEGWHLEEILAPMQVSFPKLTDLQLTLDGETVPVIPDSFLDGSAPSLRTLELTSISFPGVPKLLLSATQLVYLWLFDIPHSGYISPETMISLLCASPSLDTLHLGFQSPQSRPHPATRRLPPPKRSILRNLQKFRFKGVTEYLEDLVTSIDTPRLDDMDIAFFNQIDFDCPRLAQFINRTSTLWADKAHVKFDDSTARVELRSSTSEYPSRALNHLQIGVSCREPDWQLSSIEQVCDTSFHPLSMVENLYIEHKYSQRVWKNDAIVNTLWSELLLPFTAVKNLYLSKDFAPGIAAALQEFIGSRTMEVLPSLQKMFVEALEPSGPFQKNIGQFLATRQLSNHPISIYKWNNVTDALSYLNAVKDQLKDRPDVYNVFLDTMKDFRSEVIDTPGVIQRVATLFHSRPSLIQAFNTFLPVGYRIEVGSDAQSSEVITVTTPSATILHPINSLGIPPLPPTAHLPQEPNLLPSDQPPVAFPLPSTSALGLSNTPKLPTNSIDVSTLDDHEREGLRSAN